MTDDHHKKPPFPLPRRDFLIGGTLVGASAAFAAPPKTSTASSVEVHVWHDTICPWCRIGLHNLYQAIDQYRAEAPKRAVRVVVKPFLLDPNTPEGGSDIRERLRQKYGRDPEAMFQRVTQAGAAAGLTFNFAKVRKTPPTLRSHALLLATKPEKLRAMVDALGDAYFERGEDLGDLEVLLKLAQKVGSAPRDLRQSLTNATKLAEIRKEALGASVAGIRGVPHFVIGKTTLHGAQPPAKLLAAIRSA